MKLLSILILLCGWTLSTHANDVRPYRAVSATLTQQHIASIKPAKDTTREAFDRDWGQFEVLIPKSRFPILAPNCRKNVILRMPGAAPDVPQRDNQLDARWRQFQSFHRLAEGTLDHVGVDIASGPYMNVDKHGKPVLQYCNAYIAIRTTQE